LIELAIAKNIIEKRISGFLIMTPLAVAFQFILEAAKLGIDDIEIFQRRAPYKEDCYLQLRTAALF